METISNSLNKLLAAEEMKNFKVTINVFVNKNSVLANFKTTPNLGFRTVTVCWSENNCFCRMQLSIFLTLEKERSTILTEYVHKWL